MIVDCNTLFGFWPRRLLNSDLESVKREAASHGITTSLICSTRGIFDSHGEVVFSLSTCTGPIDSSPFIESWSGSTAAVP